MFPVSKSKAKIHCPAAGCTSVFATRSAFGKHQDAVILSICRSGLSCPLVQKHLSLLADWIETRCKTTRQDKFATEQWQRIQAIAKLPWTAPDSQDRACAGLYLLAQCILFNSEKSSRIALWPDTDYTVVWDSREVRPARIGIAASWSSPRTAEQAANSGLSSMNAFLDLTLLNSPGLLRRLRDRMDTNELESFRTLWVSAANTLLSPGTEVGHVRTAVLTLSIGRWAREKGGTMQLIAEFLAEPFNDGSTVCLQKRVFCPNENCCTFEEEMVPIEKNYAVFRTPNGKPDNSVTTVQQMIDKCYSPQRFPSNEPCHRCKGPVTESTIALKIRGDVLFMLVNRENFPELSLVGSESVSILCHDQDGTRVQLALRGAIVIRRDSKIRATVHIRSDNGDKWMNDGCSPVRYGPFGASTLLGEEELETLRDCHPEVLLFTTAECWDEEESYILQQNVDSGSEPSLELQTIDAADVVTVSNIEGQMQALSFLPRLVNFQVFINGMPQLATRIPLCELRTLEMFLAYVREANGMDSTCTFKRGSIGDSLSFFHDISYLIVHGTACNEMIDSGKLWFDADQGNN